MREKVINHYDALFCMTTTESIESRIYDKPETQKGIKVMARVKAINDWDEDLGEGIAYVIKNGEETRTLTVYPDKYQPGVVCTLGFDPRHQFGKYLERIIIGTPSIFTSSFCDELSKALMNPKHNIHRMPYYEKASWLFDKLANAAQRSIPPSPITLGGAYREDPYSCAFFEEDGRCPGHFMDLADDVKEIVYALGIIPRYDASKNKKKK